MTPEIISGTGYISMALICASSCFVLLRLFGNNEDIVMMIPFVMLTPAWPVLLLLMIIWIIGWSITEQLEGRGI